MKKKSFLKETNCESIKTANRGKHHTAFCEKKERKETIESMIDIDSGQGGEIIG